MKTFTFKIKDGLVSLLVVEIIDEIETNIFYKIIPISTFGFEFDDINNPTSILILSYEKVIWKFDADYFNGDFDNLNSMFSTICGKFDLN